MYFWGNNIIIFYLVEHVNNIYMYRIDTWFSYTYVLLFLITVSLLMAALEITLVVNKQQVWKKNTSYDGRVV